MAHVTPGICLAGYSALEYWRTAPLTPSQHEWVIDPDAALLAPPSLALLDELGDRWKSTLTAPLDLCVFRRSERRVLPLAQVHLCMPTLPAQSIARVTRGLYVVSPELSFLQMARVLDLFELIHLGFELCGTYAPERRGTTGLVQRNRALTSVQSIQAALGLMRGARDRAAALRAINLVQDNAASPMESVCAMLLGMPRRLGGFGLPSFSLNHRIEFDDVARSIAHRDHAKADLYWEPARVDVEYEGRIFHEGETRMASDKARANALAHMGITTISLFDEHVQSDAMFCTMACDIARAIGFRMRPLDTRDRERRLTLRRAILRHSDGSAQPRWAGMREGEPTLGEALEKHHHRDGRGKYNREPRIAASPSCDRAARVHRKAPASHDQHKNRP